MAKLYLLFTNLFPQIHIIYDNIRKIARNNCNPIVGIPYSTRIKTICMIHLMEFLKRCDFEAHYLQTINY
jgi:hypothetical protein